MREHSFGGLVLAASQSTPELERTNIPLRTVSSSAYNASFNGISCSLNRLGLEVSELPALATGQAGVPLHQSVEPSGIQLIMCHFWEVEINFVLNFAFVWQHWQVLALISRLRGLHSDAHLSCSHAAGLYSEAEIREAEDIQHLVERAPDVPVVVLVFASDLSVDFPLSNAIIRSGQIRSANVVDDKLDASSEARVIEACVHENEIHLPLSLRPVFERMTRLLGA